MSETENTVTEVAAQTGAAPAAEEKPKPRRGRPRKVVADAPEGAAAASEAEPARRTRRTAKKDDGEEAAAASAPAEKKPTRKRTAKKADASEAAAEGAKEAKPRRTTRAKAASADGAQAESASAAEKPAEEKSAQPEAPKTEKPAEAKADVRASGDAVSPAAERTDVSADASAQEQRQGGKQQRRQQNQQRQQQKKNNDGGGKKNNNRRQRRQHHSNQQNREPAVPKTSKEELAKLKVAELRQKAEELEIEHKGLLKADLVDAVYEASVKKEGFVDVAGVLDIMSEGYGFLRTDGYLPSEHDVYVGLAMIRRNGLRKGDYVKGQVRPARENEKYAALQRIDTVNDIALDEIGKRPRFADLTPVYPDERLLMEHGRTSITARVIDLAAPIGKGQRGLIVSPPKAGKTTVLKDIAASISANNPEVHLMCLLVDERPEEVTDMQRSIKGEVISSTFDMPSENHIAVAEMVIERAKRLVENGRDVVILLDSITRLARAYNLAQPASGRILSGGVDSTALYPPKRFLGAARNIEHGGSLTILASALIDTGSKMDEVIFEEFKGTGNMELKLDRYLADRRIFPAIDPVASGTRKEDLLIDPQEAPLIWAVRRLLANMNNTERAMDMLIKSLKQTETNQQFLLRTAKKAQSHRMDDNFEL